LSTGSCTVHRMTTAVGTIIRNICDEKGWSLRELARRADLPAATVHKIVTAEGMQSRPETLEALASALGVGSRVLLEASAQDAGYMTVNTDTDSGLRLLIAGIKELSDDKQREIAALVEAMLASSRNA
jgi:transcriptional regulator with XRE-family HTH domain